MGVVFLAACAAPPPPLQPAAVAPRNYFAEAQQSLANGNVIDTVLLLHCVSDSSPDFPKAKSMLVQLVAKSDKLLNKLIARSDDALGDGLYLKSVAILSDVQTRVGADRKPEVDKKLQVARERLAAIKVEFEDKLKRGKERLRGGDAREALRLLSRASELADDNAFAWTFAEQQSLEQARMESPAPKGASAGQRDADSRRRKRRQVADNELIVGSVDTFASQEQEITRLKNTRDLVDKARDFKKKGMLYEAIVTLEEAHAKDPDSPAVKLGLDGLEDDRSRLVDGYLEVADRYFAKQELESAVPYFRRVLRLEPDNLRAKEAVQMYHNLEKIKQERTETQ